MSSETGKDPENIFSGHDKKKKENNKDGTIVYYILP